MSKTEKIEKVADLKGRIEGSQALLLADYRGLTVFDAKELRVALQEADTSFAIVKNTLMKLAADQAGLELEAFLSGPTAVAFIRGDAVLAAKRLADAAKKFPDLAIKGGFMEGKVLSAEEAQGLSKLESRDAMLSTIAGLMKSEMSRAASMLQAAQSRFVGLLEAYREKVPGEPAAAEAPPTEAEAPSQDAEAPQAEVEAAAPEAETGSETAPSEDDTPDEAPEAAAEKEEE